MLKKRAELTLWEKRSLALFLICNIVRNRRIKNLLQHVSVSCFRLVSSWVHLIPENELRFEREQHVRSLSVQRTFVCSLLPEMYVQMKATDSHPTPAEERRVQRPLWCWLAQRSPEGREAAQNNATVTATASDTMITRAYSCTCLSPRENIKSNVDVLLKHRNVCVTVNVCTHRETVW